MPRFALINTSDSSVIEFRNYATQPANPSGKARKWLPVTAGTPPAIDASTEIATAPSYTVNANDVSESLGKRNLTAQEISDAKDDAVNGLNGAIYAALAKVLLNHENRIRTLESKAAITMSQFKAGVKVLL